VITNEPPASRHGPPVGAAAGLPLENWCKFNGLAAPLRAPGNPSQAWEVPHPARAVRGVIGPAAGRAFDGVDCWLAYAPQMVRANPVSNALDAQRPPTAAEPAHPARPLRPQRRAGPGSRRQGRRHAKRLQQGSREGLYFRLGRCGCSASWRPTVGPSGSPAPTTRTFPPERVEFAERVQADLFLSLHFNAGLNSHDRAGRRRIASPRSGCPRMWCGPRTKTRGNCIRTMPLTTRTCSGRSGVQRALVQGAGGLDRGVKRGAVHGGAARQKRPAVLLERAIVQPAGSPEHRDPRAPPKTGRGGGQGAGVKPWPCGYCFSR